MGDTETLKVAIALLHMPSRVRHLRSCPLPGDVFMLLCIAANDEAAAVEAVERSGRSREVVKKAAAFYIEQILLCPEADSYRILGANRNTTSGDLRRNMAMLLRGLHPDTDPDGKRSVFARRVTRAWEDLKTSERRAAYDKVAPVFEKKSGHVRYRRGRTKSRASPIAPSPAVGLLRRTFRLLIGRAPG